MRWIKMCFPEGKEKAFTTSFDDGVLQDGRLIACMKQYGIKGTFNINSSVLGRREQFYADGKYIDISTYSPEELRETYESFEIATHGAEHRVLTDFPDGTVACEIAGDRRELERIFGRVITGHAYPYGVYSTSVEEVLRSCGITYARTTKRTGDFRLPECFLEWHPTCHFNDEDLPGLVKRFCSDSPSGQPELQLFYLWGHSFELDLYDGWERLEMIFAELCAMKKNIWFAENVEIQRYISAYRSCEFSAMGDIVRNPSAQTLWMNAEGRIVTVHPGQTVQLSSF